MKTLFIVGVSLVLFAFAAKDSLTGRWESQPSAKGAVTSAVFKTNGSFEGYVNNKPFVSGIYTVAGDTLSFVDNGCNGWRGEYRLHFFSGTDSVRFEAIRDSCAERKAGMERIILGRMK